MCVAIPGLVEAIEAKGTSRLGTVRFAPGEVRMVELAMVSDIEVGDYVIVHSGFAVRKISQEAAEEARAHFKQSG